MRVKIIKSPSSGTLELLKSRSGIKEFPDFVSMDAVGLVQGPLIDMVVAADIAEKAVGVMVTDIRGSCPQNMILLAIFGDTASVESAIKQIKYEESEESNYDYRKID